VLTTDDIVAIQQLEAFMHHAADGDLALLREVFTPDAVFDGRGCGGPLLEGRDAIVAFFALGKPPHPPAHQATNVWVYEKDGRTYAKSKWFILDPQGSGIYLGDNDDWVVKTEEGWRIREKVSFMRAGSVTPEAAAAALA
jgi:hypothetical protein